MKTIITGHRNPDVDSIMSAYALAELKHKLGDADAEAVCPGLMPEKAVWLFNKFGVAPPPRRNDVYLRVRDVMRSKFATISGSKTVFDAVEGLRTSNANTLPVVEKDGRYIGSLSLITLISGLLDMGAKSGGGLTGRSVYTSARKMARLLDAEVLGGSPDAALKTYDMFVAAMSPEFFERHLRSAKPENPVVIVGDRPEIHLRILQNDVKLIIITGNCPVEKMVVEMAEAVGTTMLRTRYDSASVTRRLKFSTPVRNAELRSDAIPLAANDMIHDIRHQVMASPVDENPVCDASGRLIGVVGKRDITAPPPFRIILVDHNETAQSIPGVEEIPVVEVVDHHRIGIKPTVEPIKYTCDVVGSTCTIVASMYRSAGIAPEPSVAALLISGIITDTLLFQSPTSTPFDKAITEWLERISGVDSRKLMEELLTIGSPLSTMSARDALLADRKDYRENKCKFALSQVEETNLSILCKLKDRLAKEMQRLIASDGLDFFGLLVTDTVRGNSELLLIGNNAVGRALPYKKNADGLYFLPGVLSRKKQLLPLILSITSELGR